MATQRPACPTWGRQTLPTLGPTRSSENLRRFTIWLAAIMSIALLAVVATPLSHFWFQTISALPPDLAPGQWRWLTLAELELLKPDQA